MAESLTTQWIELENGVLRHGIDYDKFDALHNMSEFFESIGADKFMDGRTFSDYSQMLMSEDDCTRLRENFIKNLPRGKKRSKLAKSDCAFDWLHSCPLGCSAVKPGFVYFFPHDCGLDPLGAIRMYYKGELTLEELEKYVGKGGCVDE